MLVINLFMGHAIVAVLMDRNNVHESISIGLPQLILYFGKRVRRGIDRIIVKADFFFITAREWLIKKKK